MDIDTKELKTEKKDPQESLEKVLSAEIEIATQQSDARAEADKLVEEAQNSTNKIKNEIIEKARAERDRLYKEGVKKAHEEAAKTIQESKEKAEKFLENGQKYLDEAENQVMDLLLGLEGDKK